MAATYTLPGVLLSGTHASRPAANAVAAGTLYNETDTLQAYQSDGATWTAWGPSYSGSGMANPMTTTGDIIYGTNTATPSTPARLAIGAAGYALMGGTTPAWAYPPGHEFDRVQTTSNTTINQASEATAVTIVTANAVTYDGSTSIDLSCYLPGISAPATTNDIVYVELFDGSTAIGLVGAVQSLTSSGQLVGPVSATMRITPSAAAHTYSVRAYVTNATHVATVYGGAGGTGSTFAPAFIRQVKA